MSSGVVAVVLAGGASSRFGSDKLAVSVDGRPLLHHALEAVAEIADRIVIVIAPEAPLPTVPLALAGREVFARDAVAHGGPLAGLTAGLDAVAALGTPVRDEAPRIALVVGGDMPSLVPDVLRLLATALAADPALDVMTLAASRPAPLPMALRPDSARTAIDAILASGGRRSLMALIAAVPSATIPAGAWRALDPAGASLRDIDAPTDLEG
jgi:molybdopterin-guanine dinucleotide biosynthesis protein A